MGKRRRGAVLLLISAGLALNLGAQQARPPYGTEEHNEYTAAAREQDAQARIKQLDAFLQKYPESALRPFVFQTYIQTYHGSNWPKVVEYADKFLALDPVRVQEVYKRPDLTESQLKDQMVLLNYQILYVRAQAFLLSFQEKAPNADAAADTAFQSAQQGLEHLEKLPKPEALSPEKFAELKKQGAALFHSVLAAAAYHKKDYDTAAREYKLVTEQDPNNGFFSYRLGLSYLQASRPQHLPGLWAVARAVSYVPERDKKRVRDYLLRNLSVYEGFADGCPARHSETQSDDLIAQAKTSVTPPATWTLPDSERVSAVRNELTVKRIFDELKAGGEQRHLIWVASCGMELPELTGEVLEVVQSADNVVTLRLAVGEEAADAKIPTVEVKVKEPPEAKNLKPGTVVGFSGILADYQADPFQLRLIEGKVNPEDIPKAEAPAPKPAPKRKPRPSPGR